LIDLLRDDIYRWTGAFLIISGLFFDLVGIWAATSIPPEDGGPDVGTGMFMVGMCTVLFIIPGIILFVWGYKLGQDESNWQNLAGYLKSHRRIKISEVAKKLGKSEYETETLIAKIVEQRLIVGYIDRNTREFFTIQSLFHEVNRPDKCPNCGASMHTRVLSGENAICDYCGAHFSTKHNLLTHPPPYSTSRHQYSSSTYHGVPPMMTIKCPDCSKLFDVQKQTEPFPVNCPYCGVKGTMRP
jgi:DNA-directed RNA polymerase subunit RPC12/RpoP